MNVIPYDPKYDDDISDLIALFRVHLRRFKNEETELDIEAAKQELRYAITDHYPIYIIIEGEKPIAYMMLRIDGCVFVEQIYAKEGYRRLGAATLLYEQAEKVAHELGEDTLYNFVHPNNDAMMGFLRSKGYSVLNLVEVRKPYKNETLSTEYTIGNNKFDY